MQDEFRDSVPDYQRDLWEMEARQNSYRRFQLVFQTYAVLGALVGVLSLAYFFISRLEITLSSTERMALIVSGSGFALSLMSALYLFLRHQRYGAYVERSRYMGSAGEFLLQWARFEAIGRQKLDTMKREFNPTSIRNIIEELRSAGAISQDEVIQLDEILRFRNFLVHSGSRVDPEVLAARSNGLRRILSRLEA